MWCSEIAYPERRVTTAEILENILLDTSNEAQKK